MWVAVYFILYINFCKSINPSFHLHYLLSISHTQLLCPSNLLLFLLLLPFIFIPHAFSPLLCLSHSLHPYRPLSETPCKATNRVLVPLLCGLYFPVFRQSKIYEHTKVMAFVVCLRHHLYWWRCEYICIQWLFEFPLCQYLEYRGSVMLWLSLLSLSVLHFLTHWRHYLT